MAAGLRGFTSSVVFTPAPGYSHIAVPQVRLNHDIGYANLMEVRCEPTTERVPTMPLQVVLL